MKRARWDPGIGIIALAHGAVSLWCAVRNGSVNDEFAAHVTAGYWYLETGVFSGGVANPPLGQLWVALAVWLGGWSLAPFAADGLIAARAMNVALSVALVCWVGMAARWAMGRTAGWLACGALAISPTLLAHGSLATIDLPMAFGAWAFLWCAWRWWRRPRVAGTLVIGALLGVCLGIKMTALLLPPILIAMVGATALSPAGRHHANRVWRGIIRRPWRASLAAGGFVGAVWLVLAGVYLFRGIGAPLPDGATFWLLQPLRVLPAEFLAATWEKWRYTQGGNASFVFGPLPPEGVWWYYPVILLLKEPLALIGGAVLGWLVVGRRLPLRCLPAVVVPVMFLILASFNKTQIGVRHLLPMMPFLALGFGLLASRGDMLRWRRVGYVLWVVAIARVAFFLPFPLSFASEATIGNTHRWLADSNADWGQANDAIDAWVESHPDGRVLTPNSIGPGTGIIRINALNGHGSRSGQLEWLRSQTPRARVAGAAVVYELTEEQIKDWLEEERLLTSEVHAGLLGLGDVDWVLGWFAQRRVDAEGEALAELLAAEAAFHVDAGEALEGYRLLRRATQLRPGDPGLAEQYQILERRLNAERQSATDPAGAALDRARLAGLDNDERAAREWLERAEDLGIDARQAAITHYWLMCRFGRLEEAAALADEFPQIDQGPIPAPPPGVVQSAVLHRDCKALLELAWACYATDNLEPAARLAARGLEQCPNDSGAMTLLGQIVVSFHERRWGDLSEDAVDRLRAIRLSN